MKKITVVSASILFSAVALLSGCASDNTAASAENTTAQKAGCCADKSAEAKAKTGCCGDKSAEAKVGTTCTGEAKASTCTGEAKAGTTCPAHEAKAN